MKPRTTKSVNPGVVAILLLLFTIVSNGSPASASLVADAGGPYSVLEGGSILLDASGSSADPGDTLTLAWDLDNDGQFDDATGSSVVFQGIDGPSVHPVAVRASTQKTLFWDVENETHQIQKSLFWDFENATSAGSISTSVGAPTGAGISGVASQTGGGPAETFGGGAGKVHLTRFLGPVNYPYIDVTTTSAMRLESISFLHIHNHNPGFPTQFGYQVQLQIDSGSGFSNIGSPLAINAGNSGDTSTINLGSTLIGAGTHRIRWLASGFSSGSNSNTEFFAINDLNLVASVTVSSSTSVGAATGSGISGILSQTGGGPAEFFGGVLGKVHLTRFLGPVNYPYIDVTTTAAMRLENISFLHIHNHNPGFPTQFGYQVQLQIDSGGGFSNIGSPLAINAGNSGQISTINLGSTLVGAGTHRIRWLASGFSSGSNSNTEFFAINDLNLVASVQDVSATTVTVNNVAPSVNAGSDATINEGGTFVRGPACAGAVLNPANKHWYAAVPVSGGINYNSAKAAAAALSCGGVAGHLVTITSAAENAFIVANLPNAVNPTPSFNSAFGYWTGAELVGSAWTWVTGEPFSFFNWSPGEPNGFPSENRIHFWTSPPGSGKWNDAGDFWLFPGYVVEFESQGSSFNDPGADTWTATVNYGDGTGVQPLALNPDKTFNLNHPYVDEGAFTVTVCVTDDDLGTGCDTLTVTVKNVAPTITSVSSPATIPEGGSVVLSATATDPGVSDTLLFSFNCDSQGPFEVTGSLGSGTCSYADNGIFTVTVLVSDGDGGTNTTTTSVTVTNVAPTVTVSGPASVNEGTSATYTASISDPGILDTHTVTWDCNGDGLFNEGSGLSVSCTFPDGPATVAVAARAVDKDGGAGTGTLPVTVVNVPPTITAAFQVASIPEASVSVSGNIVAQATDPAGSNDPLTFTFDCNNDGTFETPANPNTSAADCFFDDSGSYTVGVRVDDGDGGVTTGSATAIVTNVAPTAFLANVGPVDEGSSATVEMTNQFDPSTADTTAGFHYAFDFNNDGSFEVGDGTYSGSAGSASAAVPAALLADGPRTVAVRGRIIDKDGGVNDYTATITVNNVAPTVAGATGDTISEGGTASASATFSDPGVLDTHSATIDWGDGASDLITAAASPIGGSHVYGDNGVFAVTVTVTDKDGGTGSATATVTVGNVAPSLTLDTSGATGLDPENTFFLGVAGVPQNHSASATDPGSDDLTFSWNFGPSTTYLNDGVGVDPLPSPAGVFPFAATDTATATFTEAGVHEIVVEVTDDDGGTASASLTKVVVDGNQCARSKGFWRHQFSDRGRQHIDDATLGVYLSIVNRASLVFSEFVDAETLETAALLFDPREQNDRDNNRRQKKLAKALEQLLAAWLNFASGGVGWDEQLTIEGDDDDALPPMVLSFHDAMAMAEAIILDPASTENDLNVAKDLAEAVNESDENNPACGDDDLEDDDEGDDEGDRGGVHSADQGPGQNSGKGNDKDKGSKKQDERGNRGRR